MPRICALFALVGFSLSCPAPATATDLDSLAKNWDKKTKYYVSPTGNDSNNGTSVSLAWKTIRKAAETVSHGNTVIVAPGTYQDSTTIYFSKTTNGNSQCVFYADTTGRYFSGGGDVVIMAPATQSVWTWYVNQGKNYVFSGFRFVEDPTSNIPNYDGVTNDAQQTAYYANWNSYVHTHGFVAYQSSNVVVHNCSFKQFRHAAHFSVTTNCSMYDCRFEETGYMQLYVWGSTSFLANNCEFKAVAPKLAYGSGFLFYSWGAEVTATDCTFDTEGMYRTRETVGTADPYKVRYLHHAYHNGLLNSQSTYDTYTSTYGASGGKFTATNCNFRYGLEHSACGVWLQDMTVTGCTFTECRYGIHGHAEELNLKNNTLEQTNGSLWQTQWSWGVYANRFNSPNNRSYQTPATTPSYVVIDNNPQCKVEDTTIRNYPYGLLIGSNDIALKRLTITGNTDYAYNASTGWTGTRRTYGVYCGWDADSVTLSGSDDLTLSGHWCSYASNSTDMTYKSLTITALGNGCEHSNCSASYEQTKIENCGANGATHWWCKSLTAIQSEFTNNGAQKAGGWGLYFYGQKQPRTPNDGTNPNYDSYLETYVYGTGLGEVNLTQCKFTGNGQGAGGGGGVFLAYCDAAHVTLSKNEVTDNYWYGVYLFDGQWNLANNNEFEKISGNQGGIWISGYRNPNDSSDPYCSCNATITNYSLTAQSYGISATNSHLTVSNTAISGCQNYGLSCWNGHLKATGMEVTQCGYGLVADYNFTNELSESKFNENTYYGAILRPFESFYGVNRTFTYAVDKCEFNKNGQYGLYTYAVKHTLAGAWDIPSPTRFALSNVKCNENGAHGLTIYYGWIEEQPGRNIVCNNNGSYAANGAGNWGTGLYVGAPQFDIELSDALGVKAENNSWAGMYFYNYYWLIDPATGKYHFTRPELDFQVKNFTQGPNKYYGVRMAHFHHVGVSNGQFQSGVYLEDPTGAVAFTGNTFTGCYNAAYVSWGNNEYYRDLATGKVDNFWWNTYAVVPSTLPLKPASIAVDSCTFQQGQLSGFTAVWWYNWNVVDTDANKRVAVSLANSTFTQNGYRGFETYNNDASISQCTVTGNGLSGGLVWNGSASLTDSAFNGNCFGRWNGSVYTFGAGDKWSWVACEITHGTADGRKHSYAIENCTFDENEGYGLYLNNVNGAAAPATIANCQAQKNAYSGMYAIYADVAFTNCQANENGGTTAGSGHGLLAIYNNAQVTDCVTSNNTGWGLYVHGPYAVDASDGKTYALGGKTGVLQNCTANNNWSSGILAWCNSASLVNCTALDNGPQNSTAISGTGIQVGFDDKAQTYSHTLSGCRASGGWAGLYAFNTRCTIENSNFDGSRYGGFHQNSQLHRPLAQCTISHSTFNNNGCYGIDHYDTNSTLQFVECKGNGKKGDGTPTGYGGYGIIFTDAWRGQGGLTSQVMANCELSNNANYGLYSHYQLNSRLERSRLTGNGTYGVYSAGVADATFKNNLVVSNTAGMFLHAPSGAYQVWNNTIAHNQSVNLRPYTGTGEIRNNILAAGQYGLHIDSAAVTASHNLVQGNTSGDYWHPTKPAAELVGAGDVSKPPRFVSVASGDFRLDKGSPAINAGHNAQGTVDDDLAGNSRPMFKKFEIGAYEFTEPDGSLRVLDWQETR